MRDLVNMEVKNLLSLSSKVHVQKHSCAGLFEESPFVNCPLKTCPFDSDLWISKSDSSQEAMRKMHILVGMLE